MPAKCALFLSPHFVTRLQKRRDFVFQKWDEIPCISKSLMAQTVKKLPAMQTPGSIPGLGRSPGGGRGNQLQYSCLENSMDDGYSPWVAKNQT